MKKQKIFLARILLLLFLISILGGCIRKQKQKTDSFLIKTSIDFTKEVDRLAESKEYIQIILGNEKKYKKIIKRIGQKNYNKPESAVIVSISDKGINKILNILYKELELKKDAFVYEYIKKKMTATDVLANRLSEITKGIEWLSAVKVLSNTKVYNRPEGLNDLTYVFLNYKNEEADALVTFSGGKENYIEVNAAFIPPILDGILEEFLDDIEIAVKEDEDIQKILKEVRIKILNKNEIDQLKK